MTFTYFVDFCFFLHNTATSEIYTLSLHDALPIYFAMPQSRRSAMLLPKRSVFRVKPLLSVGQIQLEPSKQSFCSLEDRKSTRLNSSHLGISYAVFCLKKKKTKLAICEHEPNSKTK